MKKRVKVDLSWRVWSLIIGLFILIGFIGLSFAYGGTTPPIMGHSAGEVSGVCLSDGTNCPSLDSGKKMVAYYAPKSTRGNTTVIPESVIIDYCGDDDGCEVRLVMYDWDGTNRSASREFLVYYNSQTKNWRSSADLSGTNNDGLVNSVSNHLFYAWDCYFTDATYSNWNSKDDNLDFGLLSWNTAYNAECRLFIYD